MAEIQLVYRATLYGPDGVTPLSPRSGASHSDPFQIATATGITGFQPYMEVPRGRRGRLDALERKLDTGRLSVTLLDKRTGTDNLDRWWTSFMGDTEGVVQQLGLTMLVEESTDGGASWSDYFTGDVRRLALQGRTRAVLELRDRADQLRHEVFLGRPHASATYAFQTSVLPIGLPDGLSYGGFSNVRRLPARVNAWAVSNWGSGYVLEVLQDEVVARDGDTRALVIPQALRETDDLRVHIEVRTGARAGETGVVLFSEEAGGQPYASLLLDEDGHRIIQRAFVEEVDAADPEHIALSGLDTETVWFYVTADREASDDAPLFIDDVHPVQLWADLLDGYFGRLETDGSPVETFPRLTTAFDTLIADPSFGTFRGIVKDTSESSTWVEQHICIPYELGYRINGSGQVVPFDMRIPTSFAGVGTIGAADLDTSENAPAPTWEDAADTAITDLKVLVYEDFRVDTDLALEEDAAEYPALPPAAIDDRDHPIIPVPFGRAELGDNDYFTVDALGWRWGGRRGLFAFLNIVREAAVRARALGLANALETTYGSAVAHLTVPCRRTANTNDVQVGDVKLVDVDEFPDPSTNLRGGVRACRCLERREEGLRLVLRFMDLGPDVVAVAPSIGVLSLVAGSERSAINVPVTLNAQGERVRLETAVTPTSTATRPADDSQLWRFARSVTASATEVLRNLPAGRRVWVRARTQPAPAEEPQLPSGWVYSSGDDFVDLQAMTAPTVSHSNLTATTVDLTITPGEDDVPIRVILEQGAEEVEVEVLPAGSTFYQLRGLDPFVSYTVYVEHVEDNGGISARGSTAFTTPTSGSTPTAPSLRSVRVVRGTEV